MIQSDTMEETVRGILASRTVRLEPVSESFHIYGFRCLGIAEKLLDFDDKDISPVYIWHVQDDLLPISKNEIERWSIDAPGDRHWILSERYFSDDIFQDISKDITINAWGPEKLSRWIGEAVLRGDLIVKSNNQTSDESIINLNESVEDSTPYQNITLKPLIRVNDWLDNESLSMLNTLPVLINVKLWEVSGLMSGPNSITETKGWSFIEDPWSSKIYEFNFDEILVNSPDLRKIEPFEGKWHTMDTLKINLKPLLDYRKKEQFYDGADKVKSSMLEWWRADLDSLNLNSVLVQVPAWILIFEDGEKKILHSRNGKTYDFQN
jgi:hypothetical protein